MRAYRQISCVLGAFLLTSIGAVTAATFDSGSSGADGVLDPLVDVEIPLTIDGVFNYESVNIRSGVTVTFVANASNTPLIWLVQGDVTIDGVVDLSAEGRLAGPGGFDGGVGGLAPIGSGGAGQGPGGGAPGFGDGRITGGCPGGGGGYGTAGSGNGGFFGSCVLAAGPIYGREELIPLLGGSGGAGGGGTDVSTGGEGSGGGGAFLLAASGTVTINGELRANGDGTSDNVETCGGGGSGGAIRIVGNTVTGEGPITASFDPAVCYGPFGPRPGGHGRIRIETNSLLRVSSTNPPFTSDAPAPLFVPDFPRLQISFVGGIAVPANPTGVDDVQLPVNTPNPIDIELSTQDVPLEAEVSVTVTPFRGQTATVISSELSGTLASATATASVDLPEGSSTLLASVEFVVDAQLGQIYSPFAKGQLVARIRSSYSAEKGSITTFITETGDEYEWPVSAIGIN